MQSNKSGAEKEIKELEECGEELICVLDEVECEKINDLFDKFCQKLESKDMYQQDVRIEKIIEKVKEKILEKKIEVLSIFSVIIPGNNPRNSDIQQAARQKFEKFRLTKGLVARNDLPIVGVDDSDLDFTFLTSRRNIFLSSIATRVTLAMHHSLRPDLPARGASDMASVLLYRFGEEQLADSNRYPQLQHVTSLGCSTALMDPISAKLYLTDDLSKRTDMEIIKPAYLCVFGKKEAHLYFLTDEETKKVATLSLKQKEQQFLKEVTGKPFLWEANKTQKIQRIIGEIHKNIYEYSGDTAINCIANRYVEQNELQTNEMKDYLGGKKTTKPKIPGLHHLTIEVPRTPERYANFALAMENIIHSKREGVKVKGYLFPVKPQGQSIVPIKLDEILTHRAKSITYFRENNNITEEIKANLLQILNKFNQISEVSILKKEEDLITDIGNIIKTYSTPHPFSMLNQHQKAALEKILLEKLYRHIREGSLDKIVAFRIKLPSIFYSLINQPVPHTGKPLLLSAAQKGDLKIMRFLIQHGADSHLNKQIFDDHLNNGICALIYRRSFLTISSIINEYNLVLTSETKNKVFEVLYQCVADGEIQRVKKFASLPYLLFEFMNDKNKISLISLANERGHYQIRAFLEYFKNKLEDSSSSRKIVQRQCQP